MELTNNEMERAYYDLLATGGAKKRLMKALPTKREQLIFAYATYHFEWNIGGMENEIEDCGEDAEACKKELRYIYENSSEVEGNYYITGMVNRILTNEHSRFAGRDRIKALVETAYENARAGLTNVKEYYI